MSSSRVGASAPTLRLSIACLSIACLSIACLSIACLSIALLAPVARADSIFLKDGNQILDCRVVKIEPNHAAARKLLGHLRVDGEWFVPNPLVIDLRASGAVKETQKNLDLFLKTRKDIRLGVPGEKLATELDICRIDSSVAISRQNGPNLFGKAVGGPTFVASVTLSASSTWLGNSPLKAAVDGQVPQAAGADVSAQAVNNALGTNAKALHLYFDKIIERRLAALAKELKREREAAAKAADREKTAAS